MGPLHWGRSTLPCQLQDRSGSLSSLERNNSHRSPCPWINSDLKPSRLDFCSSIVSSSGGGSSTPTRKTQSERRSDTAGARTTSTARMHSCQHQGQQPLSPERPASVASE
ncbi:hypothetical protein INR49_023383 [Caranx melampygus]|nr:hypothetical protein INR49_023383 [Caranx melampygus]